MQDYIYDQFQTVGNDLLRLGLTTSHGGNMSIRHQGNMVVTVHFAMLGRLDPGDLVEVPLQEEPDQITSDASRMWPCTSLSTSSPRRPLSSMPIRPTPSPCR